MADPPRRPVEFARILGVQASSRTYRLVRGVAVDDPKTPEHAHQMDARVDVDLPLPPSLGTSSSRIAPSERVFDRTVVQ